MLLITVCSLLVLCWCSVGALLVLFGALLVLCSCSLQVEVQVFKSKQSYKHFGHNVAKLVTIWRVLACSASRRLLLVCDNAPHDFEAASQVHTCAVNSWSEVTQASIASCVREAFKVLKFADCCAAAALLSTTVNRYSVLLSKFCNTLSCSSCCCSSLGNRGVLMASGTASGPVSGTVSECVSCTALV